jgi:membrane peptidoglycan carboxypeptidase
MEKILEQMYQQGIITQEEYEIEIKIAKFNKQFMKVLSEINFN